MSLDWDLTDIENSKEKCWTPSKKEEGVFELHPITNILIWSTMLVGFNRITEKNSSKFYRRLIEFEVVTGGGMFSSYDKDGEWVDRTPTLEEVKDHIGLSTNVYIKTSRQWTAYMVSLVKEEATRRIRKYRELANEDEAARKLKMLWLNR
tara:strand:+ start:985 stop:1434 length:450 start_codon:yes stop_codon:yes gene_type:complete